MARIKSTLVMDIAKSIGGDEGEFVIIELTKDGPRPVYDGAGQLLKFMTGDDASREARARSTAGRKFQPRRVKDDQWKGRELSRYADNTYKMLPWADAVWWKNHVHIHGDHFPHVSVKNSVGLMAYTESDDKGSADIQTPIKPGKYLERFFSNILDPYMIRDLSTQFSNVFEDNCLILSDPNSEQEFEDLYTTGPGSCMSHPKEKYLSCIHPVRVYAAGDLALAYMKRDGRIVARTLVWPEKRLYSRVYGDRGRIEPLLSKEGYKPGPPIGARLKRVLTYENKATGTGNQAFVIPHIDDVATVIDKGDHLIVGNPNSSSGKGVIRIAGPNGLTEWVFLRCGCGCNREISGGVSAATPVYVDGAGNHQMWCAECVKERAITCGHNTDIKVANTPKNTVQMHDGSIWWIASFKDYGFTCAKTGQRFHRKHRVVIKEGLYVSRQWFKEHGEECRTCGERIEIGTCDEACKQRYTKPQHWPDSTTVSYTNWSSVTFTPTGSGG